MTLDLFAGPDLEERILARAAACGLALDRPAASGLAAHARAVLSAPSELHLTAITDPEEFLERHLGEAFEGAALLDPAVTGVLVDLGSGNGYPGLPLAAARPGLRLIMAEASTRKGAFLRQVVRESGFAPAEVHEAQVQRAADLADVGPVQLLASRALGGWAKIVPRLVPGFAPGGELLLWAGQEVEQIARREVWRRLRLLERRSLPGRDQSFVWRFGRQGGGGGSGGGPGPCPGPSPSR